MADVSSQGPEVQYDWPTFGVASSFIRRLDENWGLAGGHTFALRFYGRVPQENPGLIVDTAEHGGYRDTRFTLVRKVYWLRHGLDVRIGRQSCQWRRSLQRNVFAAAGDQELGVGVYKVFEAGVSRAGEVLVDCVAVLTKSDL